MEVTIFDLWFVGTELGIKVFRILATNAKDKLQCDLQLERHSIMLNEFKPLQSTSP